MKQFMPTGGAGTGAPLTVAPANRLALQLGMYWGAGAGSGGLDRIFTDIACHLPEAGFKTLSLVEGPADTESLSVGRALLYRRCRGPMGRLRGIRKTLVESLRAQRVDLVALHFSLYGLVGLDVLRRRPFVVHFHGPWSLESHVEGSSSLNVALKKAMERTVYQSADRVIVLSNAFGELVQREFGVSGDRVRLVPGHVDLDRFDRSETRAEARLRLGLPADRPVLVVVRRLKNRMGLTTLLDAMARVVKAVPDVLLCIGGAGALRPALEQRVREHGLDNQVRFLGYVPEDDLPLWYVAADANIVPTEALEGFGLVAAEALACGTPSLVTPVGGLPEVVSSLSESLVFKSTAAADIADRLIDVLRGRTPLPDQAECRAYARRLFSVSLAAERTASVYHEIVG